MAVYKTFAQDTHRLAQIVTDLIRNYDIVRVERKNSIYEVKAWKKRG